MIALKDVKGLIQENISNKLDPKYTLGFNDALSQQGERKIGINREKLAERLYTRYERHKIQKLWSDVTNKITKQIWLAEADAIISSLPELLEAE